MRIYLKNNGYAISEKFPMTVFEMEDVLDKLKQTKSVVRFEVSEHDNMKLPMSICGKEFSTDIYRLNLFAERLENLNLSEMTAFKSLLIANPKSSFEDMLLMIYGLDSVMVYPCQDCCELGKTVIENEMMPELEGCSDEILQLLDPVKVGRLMQNQEGGVFIDEHYCVTSGYEPPDINIEIGRPERCFFRLLVAPDSEKREQAHWVTLPFDEESHLYLSEMKCLELQSSLPGITKKSFNKVLEMRVLNQFSEKLSELSHNDFVKLKAVMEAENIHDISHCIECAEHLDEYQFDQSVQDQNDFGRTYLARNLPTNFNISMLESMDLFDFGQGILTHNHGEITSYGAISGRGQELYSALTVQPEQQLDEKLEEDMEEDMEEDFEPEMGGMSL